LPPACPAFASTRLPYSANRPAPANPGVRPSAPVFTFSFFPAGVVTVTSASATGAPAARSWKATCPASGTGTSSSGALTTTGRPVMGPTTAFGW
jgi:hypothetical protein